MNLYVNGIQCQLIWQVSYMITNATNVLTNFGGQEICKNNNMKIV